MHPEQLSQPDSVGGVLNDSQLDGLAILLPELGILALRLRVLARLVLCKNRGGLR